MNTDITVEFVRFVRNKTFKNFVERKALTDKSTTIEEHFKIKRTNKLSKT